jgi:hypothetical protein
MVDNKKPMAVLDIPYKYNTLLLNADEAFALFKLLCNAVPVTYDYSAQSYKFVDDLTDRPTMKAFTTVDHAKLALNSEPQ